MRIAVAVLVLTCAWVLAWSSDDAGSVSTSGLARVQVEERPAPTLVGRAGVRRSDSEHREAAASPQVSEPPEGPYTDADLCSEFAYHEKVRQCCGWPPDPMPVGPCRLVLRFVHAETGAAVACDHELWHLDAPASETWSAGARLRSFTEYDTSEMTVVSSLPAGRYRVRVKDVAPGEADPPAFDVAGDETTQVIRIVPPRRFRVRVRAYDEEGRLLLRAKRGFGLCSGTETWHEVPTWATPRSVLSDGRTDGGEVQSHWDGEGSGTLMVLEADAEGFLTDDTWRESRRGASSGGTVTYHFEGYTDLRIGIEEVGAHDRCYAALSVSTAWLRERVRHADGRRLGPDDDGLVLEGRGAARRLPDATPDDDAWKELRVHVRATKAGEEFRLGTLCPGEPHQILELPPALDQAALERAGAD